MSTLREEIIAMVERRLESELGPQGLPSLPDLIRAIHLHAAEALMASPEERARFLFFLGQVQALADSLLTDNTQAVMAEGDPNGER